MENRTNKALYGFFGFFPLAIIFLAVIFVFLMIADIEGGGRYRNEPPPSFWLFMILIFLGSILNIVGLILYVIHAAKNIYVPENSRIAWVIGIVMGGAIAMIIYFFVYIAKEDELEADRQSRMQQSNAQGGFGTNSRNPFE